MLKYLILAGLLYGVYIVFFKRQGIANKESKSDLKNSSETMVECQKCSTYISVDEALMSDGKYFCSKECVDAYHRA